MRRAHSFIELVVVLAVLATLVAILLPAVLGVRAAARRIQCMSKMRQIGVALHSHEARLGHYPGWVGRVSGSPHRMQTNSPIGSWARAILPDLDEDVAGRLWKDASTSSYRVTALICPDDKEVVGTTSGADDGQLSYAVNGGVPDQKPPGNYNRNPDVRANGVFHDIESSYYESPRRRPWLRVNNAYISRYDGTSHTILLSENVDSTMWWLLREFAGTILWDADQAYRAKFANFRTVRFDERALVSEIEGPLHINEDRGGRPGGKLRPVGDRNAGRGHQRSLWCRPSSYHTGGGVNTVFCDGSGRFVSDSITYALYAQLMTPRGAASLVEIEHRVPAPPEFRRPRKSDL